MEPSLVVPVDPAGSGELDIRARLVRPVVEDGRADAFALVETVDGLYQGVVVGARSRRQAGGLTPFCRSS